MNRNQFLKLSVISGFALAAFPQLAFNRSSDLLSCDDLIGKGNPELFGNGFKLRKEAFDAYINMKEAALKSNISLKVVSSYRDFNHQNSIWERKYKNYISQNCTPDNAIKKIIEYSTIPGTSRHHWGTDMDLVDGNVKQPKNLLNPIHFEENACFGKFKEWMDTHANDFGFYLVYTNQEGRKGFKYEPWHYSYKPLSLQYLSEYRELNLMQILQNENLMGNEHFTEAFVKSYLNENILDINPELL